VQYNIIAKKNVIRMGSCEYYTMALMLCFSIKKSDLINTAMKIQGRKFSSSR